MKHVIHDLVVSHDLEAQAAHALLSHARKVLDTPDCGTNACTGQGGRMQVLADDGLYDEEPTWEEKVDTEIARTEARLEHGCNRS